jgi:hypothetical protein
MFCRPVISLVYNKHSVSSRSQILCHNSSTASTADYYDISLYHLGLWSGRDLDEREFKAFQWCAVDWNPRKRQQLV